MIVYRYVTYIVHCKVYKAHGILYTKYTQQTNPNIDNEYSVFE